jgi:uncharacterized heparinase superfamily protein
VEVAGRNSSEVWSAFRVGRRARVRQARWSVRDGRGTASAVHDGYRTLGVRHRRLVSHLAPGLWLVADRLGGEAAAFASRLHLHPECVVERSPSGAFRIHRGERTLTVTPFGTLSAETEDGWFCPEFGVRRRSSRLTFRGRGPAVFGFLLAADGREGATVAAEGRTIRVRTDGGDFLRRIP